MIDFDTKAFYSGAPAITLAKDLPLVTKNITITGFSSNSYVKIDGGDTYQALIADTGVNLTVSGITVQNAIGGFTADKGNLTLSNLYLYSNTTTGDGAAINFSGGGKLTLTDSTFEDNTASGNGGSISVASGDLTISDTTISYSSASNGGGIYAAYGSAKLSNTDIDHSTATNSGGGVLHEYGSIVLRDDSTLSDCSAGIGGGLMSSQSNTTLVDSTVKNNACSSEGGGVHAGRFSTDAGNIGLYVLRSTIAGNYAGSSGGGIFGGTTTASIILNSTISGNTAGTIGKNSTGGGFWVAPASNGTNAGLLMENTTVSGNTADKKGGGIYFGKYSADSATLRFVTISENSAGTSGGGIATAGSGNSPALDLEASIVSGNTVSAAEDDFDTDSTFAVTISDSATLGQGGIGTLVSDTNPVSYPNSLHTDLDLLSLASNGGPTQTMKPNTGSPLIDHTSTSYDVPTDQQGYDRLINSDYDVGAVEVGGSAVSTPTVSTVTINNGASQRSRLTRIDFTFSAPVAVNTLLGADGITLTRTLVASHNKGTLGEVVQSNGFGNHGRVLFSVTTGTTTSLTITFDNADASSTSDGVEDGSLADGRWYLEVPALGYISTYNGTTIRRLFGDIDNNGTVDATDASYFPPFGTVSNATGAAFDFDNNGTIDAVDFAAFGGRNGYTC